MKELSRRTFVASSLAAGIGLAGIARAAQPAVIERTVAVKTPDGTCDAAFMHPARGAHPGVLIWHDSMGLRAVFHELGKRIAGEGYAVLVPNLYYREVKAPPFSAQLDMRMEADREKYGRTVGSFLEPGAAERDAIAYVAFLDAQKQVDRKRRIGTHGYCLGGPFVIKTAAAVPERIGAGASFHGGFLVTDKPDSPHLLAPKIKARLYVAIAADDDQREPHVKEALKEAFAANGRAEIDVYPNALHGWCVPDNDAARNVRDAERAWNKLTALYRAEL